MLLRVPLCGVFLPRALHHVCTECVNVCLLRVAVRAPEAVARCVFGARVVLEVGGASHTLTAVWAVVRVLAW